MVDEIRARRAIAFIPTALPLRRFILFILTYFRKLCVPTKRQVRARRQGFIKCTKMHPSKKNKDERTKNVFFFFTQNNCDCRVLPALKPSL